MAIYRKSGALFVRNAHTGAPARRAGALSGSQSSSNCPV